MFRNGLSRWNVQWGRGPVHRARASAPVSPAPLIRYATGRDAPAIARLYEYTTRIAYRGYVPDAILDTRSLDDLTQLWTARISQSPSKERRILVAVPTRETQELRESTETAAIADIAGFLAIGAATSSPETPTTGEVHYIFVAPQQWSSGLGRMFMQHAIDLLCADGYQQAILWVFSANTRARRFYESTGWHFDGFERPDPAFATFPHPPLEMRYRTLLARHAR